MSVEMLDKNIRRIPDFPKPGVLFYDITSVLVNPESFKYVIDQMILNLKLETNLMRLMELKLLKNM